MKDFLLLQLVWQLICFSDIPYYVCFANNYGGKARRR